MTSIFTEDLDRARIDLNEAERKLWKAEREKDEAVKQRRVELERAEGLQRRLNDLIAQSDTDHKLVMQLKQQLDRLQGLEPELATAKSELRDANDQVHRLLDELDGLRDQYEQTVELLNEKKGEVASLARELQPTRKLLGHLRVWMEAESGMRHELESWQG